MVTAVGFDLGETLIHYPGIPPSWQSLYGSAIRLGLKAAKIEPTPEVMDRTAEILLKYNTRVNPRIEEVTSYEVFGEILRSVGAHINGVPAVEEAFFSYFQRRARPFEDTLPTLALLRSRGIKVGVLTDVPYGMENRFVMRDLAAIGDRIDSLVTSVDVGFRKPDRRGYVELLCRLGTSSAHGLFVGNEPKDIEGANAAGLTSVLVDRDRNYPSCGEDHRIATLLELRRYLA